MNSTRHLQPAGDVWPQHPEQSKSNIRRIRQACTNCRHRKTKCSGERPRCINCRRVDRVCQYEPYAASISTTAGGSQSQSSSSGPRKPGAVSAELLNRINTIESQLAQLSGQGQGLSNPSIQIHNGHQSSLHEVPTTLAFPEPSFDLQESGSPPDQRRFSASMPHPSDFASSNASRFNTLPPHSVMQSLIDTYFLHSHNQPYSYFQEQSFRDRLAYGLLPKCLVFAVLASALRFSDNEYFRGRVQEAIEAYAREAWLSVLNDHMTAENCPNLHVAQATNILAIVDFTAGRTSSGWLKIGLAVRIAQDLGLMMEPKSTLPAIEKEERRRAFWSIYLLDKLVSCGQGRPPAISDNDCHLQLPCDQESFTNGTVNKTVTLHKLSNWNTESESVKGTFALTILAASTLGRCVRYSLHQCEADDALPWDSRSEFSSVNSDLLLVEHHLQSENCPIADIVDRYKKADGTPDHQAVSHVVFAWVIFHLCHCLLNHPFLLQLRLAKLKCRIPSTFWASALHASRVNSLRLVEMLNNAAAAGCHVQSSFYVYAISVAGSILSMSSHFEPKDNSEYLKGYQEALQTLDHLGQAWEHASKMHIQLLLFDAHGSELSRILDLPGGSGVDPRLEPIFWSMLNYDTMCNPESTETLLGSIVPDDMTLSNSLGLDIGYVTEHDCSSNLLSDVNGAMSPGYFVSL